MKVINLLKSKSGVKTVSAFGSFFSGNVWDKYIKGGLK